MTTWWISAKICAQISSGGGASVTGKAGRASTMVAPLTWHSAGWMGALIAPPRQRASPLPLITTEVGVESCARDSVAHIPVLSRATHDGLLILQPVDPLSLTSACHTGTTFSCTVAKNLFSYYECAYSTACVAKSSCTTATYSDKSCCRGDTDWYGDVPCDELCATFTSQTGCESGCQGSGTRFCTPCSWIPNRCECRTLR